MTEASQRTYRRLLEAFLRDHGDKPVALLQPHHILRILEERAKTPALANALRNVLRQLLQHAFERGWRKDNPIRDVKRLRYAKKPFCTWAKVDIAAFEVQWARGRSWRWLCCCTLGSAAAMLSAWGRSTSGAA